MAASRANQGGSMVELRKGPMSILPTVLPRLRGVWLALYRAIWIAAAAVTLVSAAGATWLEIRADKSGWQSLVHREYGLGLRVFANATANPWYVASAFGPEAKAAGIPAGDQVASINGVAVSGNTPSATVAQALSSKEGERTVFRLRAS